MMDICTICIIIINNITYLNDVYIHNIQCVPFYSDHYINLWEQTSTRSLSFHKFLKISCDGKGVKKTFEKKLLWSMQSRGFWNLACLCFGDLENTRFLIILYSLYIYYIILATFIINISYILVTSIIHILYGIEIFINHISHIMVTYINNISHITATFINNISNIIIAFIINILHIVATFITHHCNIHCIYII